MESEACCSNQTSLFSVIAECPALLEQVPETFFLGTTHVGLRCFDVSKSYFVFGSDCGALFPYNRRINRSATPLRTHYDEVITCVRLASDDNDILAAGHKSGILVILRFPSNTTTSRRKIQQHLNPDLHQGSAITTLEWGGRGNWLYSGDSSGVVCGTFVDFDEECFESRIICERPSSVRQLSYASKVLAVKSDKDIILLKLDEESDKRIMFELGLDGSSEVSFCFAAAEPPLSLFIGSSSGVVDHYNVSTGELLQSICLKDRIGGYNTIKGSGCVFSLCKVFAFGDNVLYCCNKNLVLLTTEDRLRVLDSHHLSFLELDMCYIEDIRVDFVSVPVIYILTNDKRVFYVSSEEPPYCFRVVNERPQEFNPLSLISSIQKTTKLLSLAPTKAILNRIKSKGDQALPSLTNLSRPVFKTVLNSGEAFLKNRRIFGTTIREIDWKWRTLERNGRFQSELQVVYTLLSRALGQHNQK
ncbi:unnamed protein product [Enterobius vermicularis]|uniref:WD_REPEATS_REGION domain-containing protein n=1 Tax=Enterobius vermicularis TaxID=51028 RepID=A0A0N4V8B9_ENTVE|nr:unnamed protein product [Enterobius vermicularis]